MNRRAVTAAADALGLDVDHVAEVVKAYEDAAPAKPRRSPRRVALKPSKYGIGQTVELESGAVVTVLSLAASEAARNLGHGARGGRWCWAVDAEGMFHLVSQDLRSGGWIEAAPGYDWTYFARVANLVLRFGVRSTVDASTVMHLASADTPGYCECGTAVDVENTAGRYKVAAEISNNQGSGACWALHQAAERPSYQEMMQS